MISMENTMKFLTAIITATIAVASLSANAGQYKFVAGNDNMRTQLCVAAGNNQLIQYNSQVNASGLSKHHLAKTTLCNGLNIGTFAAKYDAMRTAKQINRFRKGSITITDVAFSDTKENQDVTIITVN